MRNTRVLIVSGFSAYFKQGGGEAEAVSLCASLELHGFDADLYGPNVIELEVYDFVIFFSCHPSGMELLEACIDLSIKFLFWPNFWIESGRLPSPEERNLINKYCRHSVKTIIKSNVELTLFQKHFDLENEKILRVNWFVDADFAGPADASRFKELYGVNDYILSVGLIEPIKNQMALIKAVRLAGKKLVLIGGFRKKDYFDACRIESAGEVIFIPHLPANSPILKAAYAGCTSYAEVSFDPPGRSSLEAAFYGRPLVLTLSDWAREIFHDRALLVSPTSVDEIQRALSVVAASAIHRDLMDSTFCNRHIPDSALSELYKYLKSAKGVW
jgi:glycosyltransferase involved in cell wall biosynthesis